MTGAAGGRSPPGQPYPIAPARRAFHQPRHRQRSSRRRWGRRPGRHVSLWCRMDGGICRVSDAVRCHPCHGEPASSFGSGEPNAEAVCVESRDAAMAQGAWSEARMEKSMKANSPPGRYPWRKHCIKPRQYWGMRASQGGGKAAAAAAAGKGVAAGGDTTANHHHLQMKRIGNGQHSHQQAGLAAGTVTDDDQLPAELGGHGCCGRRGVWLLL